MISFAQLDVLWFCHEEGEKCCGNWLRYNRVEHVTGLNSETFFLRKRKDLQRKQNRSNFG